MLFFLESLSMSQKSVPLQCVFHSIRFKVNKGWSTAVLLFLCPKLNFGTFFLYLIQSDAIYLTVNRLTRIRMRCGQRIRN